MQTIDIGNIIRLYISIIEERKKWFMDVAISANSSIHKKHIEKNNKMWDLQIEVEKVCKKRSALIPIEIRALEALTKRFSKYLEIYWTWHQCLWGKKPTGNFMSWQSTPETWHLPCLELSSYHKNASKVLGFWLEPKHPV